MPWIPPEVRNTIRRKRAAKVLRAARELLARPSGWIKGRMKGYNGVRSTMAYCSLGALRAAAGDYEFGPKARDAYYFLTEVVGNQGIIEFNDSSKTRKQDVLDAFDRAIQYAETGVKP